jgi:hypothetical protein
MDAPAPPTTSEFRAFCLAPFGHEWQTPLARALGVSPRTVRRWAAGRTPIPASAWAELRKIAGADERGLPTWPRDEWIVGDGVDVGGARREYIIHAHRPRFIARVVSVDDDDAPTPDEGEADTLTGVVYRAGPGTLLCEILWIDPPPPEAKLETLLDQASDALDRAS